MPTVSSGGMRMTSGCSQWAFIQIILTATAKAGHGTIHRLSAILLMMTLPAKMYNPILKAAYLPPGVPHLKAQHGCSNMPALPGILHGFARPTFFLTALRKMPSQELQMKPTNTGLQ